MKVDLFLTCLCDAVYGEVGLATVYVLELAGCKVQFRGDQTCCGQPPFNAGDWDAARPIAQRAAKVFALKDPRPPIVVPSASCAAMLRHGYGMLGVKITEERVYELCEFIVDVLKKDRWPGRVPNKKIALHKACHARMLGLKDQQETLVSSIEGVTVVPFEDQDQCCGFGGAFSITHGKTSEGIGLEKIRQLEMAGVDIVVSGDLGCLAHLEGLADRNGSDLKFMHVAQLLMKAMNP